MQKRYTKQPQVGTSVRLPERDHTMLFAAAKTLGISRSEAVRRAVQAFTTSVLLGVERPIESEPAPR